MNLTDSNQPPPRPTAPGWPGLSQAEAGWTMALAAAPAVLLADTVELWPHRRRRGE